MKRGVIFGVFIPPRWQWAKSRYVCEIYAIFFISSYTQIFKIKVPNHKNMVAFYI